MKMLVSALAATVLATAFAFPLNAAPIAVPQPEQVQALETVKHWKGRRGNRHWRDGHHWNNRHSWRSCRYSGSCYPRRYGYRNYYPRYYQPYYPGYYRPYYRPYYPRSGVSIYQSF
jgi:hypothetical protein